ncbi:hypothetical protein Hanom_Chr12g01070851 [Helianthus anomalus]
MNYNFTIYLKFHNSLFSQSRSTNSLHAPLISSDNFPASPNHRLRAPRSIRIHNYEIHFIPNMKGMASNAGKKKFVARKSERRLEVYR